MSKEGFSVPPEGLDVSSRTLQEAPSKRLIFLDVDGVLNSMRTLVAFESFDPGALDRTAFGLLDRLCQETGAEVVISSSWRILYPHLSWWETLFLAFRHIKVIGFTPRLSDAQPQRRGREVLAWLAKNAPGATYCCIDDDSDFLPENNLVLTRFEDGLQITHIDAAHRHLTGEPMPGLPRIFAAPPVMAALGAVHEALSAPQEEQKPSPPSSPKGTT